MGSLLPSQADAVARRLTDGRVRIEADDRGVYLVSSELGAKIHLLPYQLTEEGIAQAINDFVLPEPSPPPRN